MQWKEAADRKVNGLTEQPAASGVSIDSCKQACLSNPACLQLDYNLNARKCYLGYTKEETLEPVPGITHFSFNRNCNSELFLALCSGILVIKCQWCI